MKKAHSFEIILIFAMTLTAYGYFFNPNQDVNARSRLALVKSIVEEGRFEIDSFWQINDFATVDVAKFHDHYYSDKAIGSSLIGVAFYAPIHALAQAQGRSIPAKIFKELITFLAISLLCALLGPFLYSFLKKITGSPRYSLAIAIAICLGTPLYQYSTVYYGHALVGLFLFTVLLLWFNIKDEVQISPIKVLISGYLLGYAIITEYPTAIIALLIGLYILYILWTKKHLFDIKIYGLLLLGALPPLLIALAYNYAVFQDPFKTGYSYEVVRQFREGQGAGVMGIGIPNLNVLFDMTLHPTMGIFWQSPFLLFAFVGWFQMWKNKQYRAEAILSFSIILIYSLLMSGYYIWWGGTATTPRNLIPIFPFFCVPFAFIVKKWGKWTVLIFVLISIAQTLILTGGQGRIVAILAKMPRTSISTMFRQPTILYNGYLPEFLQGNLGENRAHEFFHLWGFAGLLPLAIIEAALLAIFLKITSTPKPPSAQPISEGMPNANDN